MNTFDFENDDKFACIFVIRIEDSINHHCVISKTMRASRVIIILAIIVFGGVEGGAKCSDCFSSAMDSTMVAEFDINGVGNGIVADSLAVDSSYSGR